MTQPSNSSLTIDGTTFDAFNAQVCMATHHDFTGMPHMGQQFYTIFADIDVHDTTNVDFQTLRKIYELSHNPVRDSIRPMKVTYWSDEAKTDAICTYSFEGWISKFIMASGGGTNHVLHLCLVPKLGKFQ